MNAGGRHLWQVHSEYTRLLWPAFLQVCEGIVACRTAAGEYNDFLDAAAEGVKRFGLSDAVVGPSKVSGIPYWLRRARLKLPWTSKAYDFTSAFAIALGASAYWQRSKNGDPTVQKCVGCS